MRTILTTVIITLIISVYTKNSFAQVPSYVPDSGLVAWYPFNGNANDESGNNLHAIFITGTFQNDRYGTANSSLYINGSQMIGVPTDSSILYGDTFSIALWNLPISFNFHNKVTCGIIGNPLSWVMNWGPLYGIQGDHMVYHPFNCNTYAPNANGTVSNIPTGIWHHLAFIIEGNKTTFYLDGQIAGTDSNASSRTCFDPNMNIYFGGDIGGGAIEYHNGYFDDIGIWKRALSQSEIAELYAPCLAPAPVVNNVTLCNPGTVTLTASGGTNYKWYDVPNGGIVLGSGSSFNTPYLTASDTFWVLNFDTCESARVPVFVQLMPYIIHTDTGICHGDSVIISMSEHWVRPEFALLNVQTPNPWPGQAGIVKLLDDFGTSQVFSVSFWVYPEAVQNGISVILDCSHGSSNNWVLQTLDAGATWTFKGVSFTLLPGVWQHLLMTFNNGTVKIYRNGILQTSVQTSNISYTSNRGLYFGNWPEGGRRFNGRIDELVITNNILYGSNFNPVSYNSTIPSGSTGLWHFDEGAGTSTTNAVTQIQSGQFTGISFIPHSSGESSDYSFLWSTGDTTGAIRVAPSQTENYYVTVSGNNMVCADSVTISVSQQFTLNLPDTVGECNSDTVYLDAGQGYETYLWNTGDTTFSITVDSSGMYYVTVTDGCSVEDSIMVFIYPEITLNDTTICQGQSLTIGIAGDPGIPDSLVLADNFVMTFMGPYTKTFNALVGAYYTMTVSGTWAVHCNSYGQMDAAFAFNQSVPSTTHMFMKWNNAPIRPSPDIYRPDHIYHYELGPATMSSQVFNFVDNPYSDNCGSLTFKIYQKTQTDSYNYHWSTGDTTRTIEVSPVQSSTYYVTITNEGGSCMDSIRVNVSPAPIIGLPVSTTGCQNQTVTLIAGSEPCSYSWNTGDTTRIIQVSQPGWYKVTADNGCEVSDSTYVHILDATITPADTTIAYGDSVILSVPPNYTMPDGAKAWYPFNGNANDESGNGRHATVLGPVPATDRFGNTNSAYYFDGINDIIRYDTHFIDLGSNYTISWWFSTANINKVSQTMINSEPHTGLGVNLNYTGDHTIRYGLADPSGTAWNIVFSGIGAKNNFVQNRWYHFAIVHTDDTIRSYIDGIPDYSHIANIITHPVGFKFGSIGNLAGGEVFAGNLDDYVFYDRALTIKEIQGIKNSERPDLSYIWSTGDTTRTITVRPQNTTRYYVTITHNNTICVDSISISVIPPPKVQPNIKIFLQGAWAGADTMASTLNKAGLISHAQAYNSFPWDYAGTESVSVFPANMTDWVLVELRSSIDTIVARRAGILLSNGMVVDTNGQAGILFDAPAGNYYIAVHHRNHLPLMSRSKVWLPDTTLYNFTDTLSFPIYGNCVIDVTSGISAMISGDLNHDGQLKYSGSNNDRSLVLQKILSIVGGTSITATTSGYHQEDLNMNGQVKYSGAGNDPSLIIQNIVYLTGLNSITGVFTGCVPPGHVVEPAPEWVCGDTLTDTRDSQQYPTVQIGTQCWMAKNLNIGVMVTDHYTGNLHTHCSNNGIIEKYCYYNDPANCAIYGGLYDWNEMMGYTTTPGTQGICPTGWHIPTDAEWDTLTDYLGNGSVAGGMMKSTGTTYWNLPNTGATNSSGFTALGAGYRFNNGNFYFLRYSANFWSSSEASSTNGVRRSLGYDYASVGRGPNDSTIGFSARCLRN